MSPVARWLAPLLGTVLLLAPLVSASILLARDLHDRPASRRVVEVVRGDALAVGEAIVVRIAPSPWPCHAIVLTPAAQVQSDVTVRVCGPDDACVTAHETAADGGPIVLPLAHGVRAGEVRLTVISATGGRIALRRWGDRPAVEAVQGFSWRLPAIRARELFRAFARRDLLLPALAVHASVLLIAFVVALVLTFDRSERRERDASATAPEAPDALRRPDDVSV
jgi:hypothetical protein